MLRLMDCDHEMRFTDIAAPEFQAGDYGLSQDALMPTDKAFAKLPKGTLEELLKPENKKEGSAKKG